MRKHKSSTSPPLEPGDGDVLEFVFPRKIDWKKSERLAKGFWNRKIYEIGLSAQGFPLGPNHKIYENGLKTRTTILKNRARKKRVLYCMKNLKNRTRPNEGQKLKP